MNRWIHRTVTSLSITTAIALGAGSVALAHEAEAGEAHHGHAHRTGLLGEALKLDSLTSDQRTAIDQFIAQRRAASVPVRQADAQVLTVLAQGVEASNIDHQALAPALSAEEGAAIAQSITEKNALDQLHALLTPAQRSQLVDRIEAEHARADGGEGREDGGQHRMWGGTLGLTAEQKAQLAASLRAERSRDGGGGRGSDAHRGERLQALESFRGDSFDATALVRVERRGERAESFAEALVPVLTPAQRSEFAKHLRARAAHESRS